MEEELAALGISAEAWAQTPPVVQDRLRALLLLVSALQQQLAQALELQQQVQARIEALEARLNQHSQNSSRPPSSDPPDAPAPPAKTPRGRPKGGQPGHRRHTRPEPAAEQIVARPEYWPTACPHCQHTLSQSLADAQPPRIQYVWELPAIQPEVTAHTFHSVTCPGCGRRAEAPRPASLPPGNFGPRLTALIGLLRGRFRLSQREVANLLAEWCALPISVGMVAKLQHLVGQALQAVVADLQLQAQQEDVVYLDDTGWWLAGKQRWLWTMAAEQTTVFTIDGSRKAATLRQLLGADYQGFVVSDRGRVFLKLTPERHQFCWAHLLRNFRALSERRGAVGRWGADLLALSELVFRLWHAYQGGSLSLGELQTAMLEWVGPTLKTRLQAAPERSTAALALREELLAHWPALWTFLYVEGLEPTNNRAERALRPAVLWRKGSFGAQSERGNEFVAGILSVVATCRQRKQQILSFLTEAVSLFWQHKPAPLLS